MVELSLLAKEAETLQKEIYEALKRGSKNVYISLHLTKDEVTGRNGRDGTVKAFGYIKGQQAVAAAGTGYGGGNVRTFSSKKDNDYQKKQNIRNRVEQLKTSSVNRQQGNDQEDGE